MRKQNALRAGASRIELLIVVFVIAILAQLIIPAIQSSRESARRAMCKDHLRQLASGAILHMEAHGFLPSGGWSGCYTADPNRGYGREQPGSWAYSLLPYVDLAALRETGKGESLENDELGPGMIKLHESAPTIFYCPSRRIAQPYPPVAEGSAYWGLLEAKGAERLPRVTKLDYAASSGDSIHHAASSYGAAMWWPKSYEQLRNETPQWTDTDDPNSNFFQTGVVHYRSEIAADQIVDGMSKTHLFGEKFMDPKSYDDIHNVPDDARLGDNQCAWSGFEWDNQRVAWRPGALSDKKEDYQPQQDVSGKVGATIWAYGSAHPTSLNMAYCDGSVRDVNYDIDLEVHRLNANRLDEELVDSESRNR